MSMGGNAANTTGSPIPLILEPYTGNDNCLCEATISKTVMFRFERRQHPGTKSVESTELTELPV